MEMKMLHEMKTNGMANGEGTFLKCTHTYMYIDR